MVHMFGNLQTNNFKIIFPASCLRSYGAAVHFVVFLRRPVPTFASDGCFKQEPSHGRSQLTLRLQNLFLNFSTPCM
jgi:hypothetical protein